MTRFLALCLLFAACTAPVVPTIPAPPASPTPFATPLPGSYRVYVLPVAMGTIDVLRAVCHSRNSWWEVSDYGMVFYEDHAGEVACVSAGVV